MKNSKNGCSSRIRIYQMPMLERALGCFTMMYEMFLAGGSIWLLIADEEIEALSMIAVCFGMIFVCVFMFFSVFKTYLCLDLKSGFFIIREFPGIKKQELELRNIRTIRLIDNPKMSNRFEISIDYAGFIVTIRSWSEHPSCRLAMFNMYNRQTKRLKSFIDRCNQYIDHEQQ